MKTSLTLSRRSALSGLSALGLTTVAPSLLAQSPPAIRPTQPKSDLSDFGHQMCRTRVNPSSGGERERTAAVARLVCFTSSSAS